MKNCVILFLIQVFFISNFRDYLILKKEESKLIDSFFKGCFAFSTIQRTKARKHSKNGSLKNENRKGNANPLTNLKRD